MFAGYVKYNERAVHERGPGFNPQSIMLLIPSLIRYGNTVLDGNHMKLIIKEDEVMKFSLKTHMIDYFLAPATAVCFLGGFGAVCVGLIHRFSYGFLLFFPIIVVVIFMLLAVSITRAAWIIKTQKKKFITG